MADVECECMLSCDIVHAGERGHLACLCALLAMPKVNINASCSQCEGTTALMQAARWGHVECVNLLLNDQRIDAEQKDIFGRTALIYAAQHGDTRCVQRLLKVPGADVNAMVSHIDMFDGTPVSYAAVRGHMECVSILLAHLKADANVDLDRDEQLMHSAIDGGNVRCIRAISSWPGIDERAVQLVTQIRIGMLLQRNRSDVVEFLAPKVRIQVLVEQLRLHPDATPLRRELNRRLRWRNCGDGAESSVCRCDVVRALVCASARGFGSMSLL